MFPHRTHTTTLALLVLGGGAAPLLAQSSARAQTAQTTAAAAHIAARPQARVVPLASPVVLDGKLDDAAWASAPVATGFTQQDPNEGKPATQRTEVRFAYDAEALYIGARMYDTLGAAGVRSRLVRRDQNVESDYIQFVFDTFHDHAGRTIFQVNPAGVKYDAGQATPSADPSWDPVWKAATHVDSLGWTAEMRIPFSQLRFSRDTTQVWGMQVWRYVQRLNETSMWSFWGKNDSGGPAFFGHLEGMALGHRPRALEILPYTLARASYVAPTQPGSPFQDRRAYHASMGADVKALLTSTLTLDATLNPDFGQVEVDPAQVNLSDSESYFDERRPFFVEGSGLFSFGGLNCFTCSDVSGMSLFYSRRIGRHPQGGLPGDPRYSDVPDNTHILGAAKVTGRVRRGWEIGVLDAVTSAEDAGLVYADDSRLTREVEPLTNYFVGRVRRTLHAGDANVGAMVTSVGRRFGYDSLALQLPAHAEAAGVDWVWTWQKRAYELRGNFALSQVSGDSAAILRLQRSSVRYFQRPDRGNGSNGFFSDAYDPGLTALRGYGGYLRMAKQAGSWLWESQVNYRSPGFEVNDLAFLSQSDYVWTQGNIRRRWTTPTRYYRYFQFTTGAQRQFNYDGAVTSTQVHGSVYAQLRNYWELSLYGQHRPEVAADRLTRGGPSVRRAGLNFVQASVNTDSRKRFVFGTSPWTERTADGARSYGLNADLRMKPASNVSVSFGPSFDHAENRSQFV
ncbi:MAG: carbohydrate binding family 9 domain-containing protein, partial [Gemmatimonadetes bacterium]|nr:carbohydrate binding family 9 domain-containing protein [Gemmatimonadota bacterium]